MLKLQPRLPYNLIGHNCEHIANMCVAAGYTESHQVRTMFGVRALVGMPFFFRYLYLAGRNRPVPKGLLAGVLMSSAASQSRSSSITARSSGSGMRYAVRGGPTSERCHGGSRLPVTLTSKPTRAICAVKMRPARPKQPSRLDRRPTVKAQLTGALRRGLTALFPRYFRRTRTTSHTATAMATSRKPKANA